MNNVSIKQLLLSIFFMLVMTNINNIVYANFPIQTQVLSEKNDLPPVDSSRRITSNVYLSTQSTAGYYIDVYPQHFDSVRSSLNKNYYVGISRTQSSVNMFIPGGENFIHSLNGNLYQPLIEGNKTTFTLLTDFFPTRHQQRERFITIGTLNQLRVYAPKNINNNIFSVNFNSVFNGIYNDKGAGSSIATLYPKTEAVIYWKSLTPQVLNRDFEKGFDVQNLNTQVDYTIHRCGDGRIQGSGNIFDHGFSNETCEFRPNGTAFVLDANGNEQTIQTSACNQNTCKSSTIPEIDPPICSGIGLQHNGTNRFVSNTTVFIHPSQQNTLDVVCTGSSLLNPTTGIVSTVLNNTLTTPLRRQESFTNQTSITFNDLGNATIRPENYPIACQFNHAGGTSTPSQCTQNLQYRYCANPNAITQTTNPNNTVTFDCNTANMINVSGVRIKVSATDQNNNTTNTYHTSPHTQAVNQSTSYVATCVTTVGYDGVQITNENEFIPLEFANGNSCQTTIGEPPVCTSLQRQVGSNTFNGPISVDVGTTVQARCIANQFSDRARITINNPSTNPLIYNGTLTTQNNQKSFASPSINIFSQIFPAINTRVNASCEVFTDDNRSNTNPNCTSSVAVRYCAGDTTNTPVLAQVNNSTVTSITARDTVTFSCDTTKIYNVNNHNILLQRRGTNNNRVDVQNEAGTSMTVSNIGEGTYRVVCRHLDTIEGNAQTTATQLQFADATPCAQSYLVSASCGNNTLDIDKGEQCDLGSNNGKGHGCSMDCQIQRPSCTITRTPGGRVLSGDIINFSLTGAYGTTGITTSTSGFIGQITRGDTSPNHIPNRPHGYPYTTTYRYPIAGTYTYNATIINPLGDIFNSQVGSAQRLANDVFTNTCIGSIVVEDPRCDLEIENVGLAQGVTNKNIVVYNAGNNSNLDQMRFINRLNGADTYVDSVEIHVSSSPIGGQGSRRTLLSVPANQSVLQITQKDGQAITMATIQNLFQKNRNDLIANPVLFKAVRKDAQGRELPQGGCTAVVDIIPQCDAITISGNNVNYNPTNRQYTLNSYDPTNTLTFVSSGRYSKSANLSYDNTSITRDNNDINRSLNTFVPSWTTGVNNFSQNTLYTFTSTFKSNTPSLQKIPEQLVPFTQCTTRLEIGQAPRCNGMTINGSPITNNPPINQGQNVAVNCISSNTTPYIRITQPGGIASVVPGSSHSFTASARGTYAVSCLSSQSSAPMEGCNYQFTVGSPICTTSMLVQSPQGKSFFQPGDDISFSCPIQHTTGVVIKCIDPNACPSDRQFSRLNIATIQTPQVITRNTKVPEGMTQGNYDVGCFDAGSNELLQVATTNSVSQTCGSTFSVFNNPVCNALEILTATSVPGEKAKGEILNYASFVGPYSTFDVRVELTGALASLDRYELIVSAPDIGIDASVIRRGNFINNTTRTLFIQGINVANELSINRELLANPAPLQISLRVYGPVGEELGDALQTCSAGVVVVPECQNFAFDGGMTTYTQPQGSNNNPQVVCGGYYGDSGFVRYQGGVLPQNTDYEEAVLKNTMTQYPLRGYADFFGPLFANPNQLGVLLAGNRYAFSCQVRSSLTVGQNGEFPTDMPASLRSLSQCANTITLEIVEPAAIAVTKAQQNVTKNIPGNNQFTVENVGFASGDLVRYQISATNNGGFDAKNIAISDTLPASFEFGSIENSSCTMTDVLTLPYNPQQANRNFGSERGNIQVTYDINSPIRRNQPNTTFGNTSVPRNALEEIIGYYTINATQADITMDWIDITLLTGTVGSINNIGLQVVHSQNGLQSTTRIQRPVPFGNTNTIRIFFPNDYIIKAGKNQRFAIVVDSADTIQNPNENFRLQISAMRSSASNQTIASHNANVFTISDTRSAYPRNTYRTRTRYIDTMTAGQVCSMTIEGYMGRQYTNPANPVCNERQANIASTLADGGFAQVDVAMRSLPGQLSGSKQFIGSSIVGGTGTYAITVSNIGTGTVHNVTVVDALPYGLRHIDTNNAINPVREVIQNNTQDRLTRTIPQLQSNQTITLTGSFNVVFDDSLSGQVITNTGSISASCVDPIDVVGTTIIGPRDRGMISLVKRQRTCRVNPLSQTYVCPEFTDGDITIEVVPGPNQNILEYEIAFTNTSNVFITGFRISDFVSAIDGLQLTDVSRWSVSGFNLVLDQRRNPPTLLDPIWDGVNLAPGSGGRVYFSGIIVGSALGDRITNTARVDRDGRSTVSNTVTAYYPQLYVRKEQKNLGPSRIDPATSANQGFTDQNNVIVSSGDLVVYRVRYTNTSPNAYDNAVLVDTYPVGFTPTARPAGFSHNTGIRELSINIGTIPAGATRDIIITGRVTQNIPQYQNNVEIRTNQATVRDDIIAVNAVQLPFTKQQRNATRGQQFTTNNIIVEDGDTVVYQLFLHNTSTQLLTNVQILDIMPVGFNPSERSYTRGGFASNGTSFGIADPLSNDTSSSRTQNILQLAANEQITIVITGTIDSRNNELTSFTNQGFLTFRRAGQPFSQNVSVLAELPAIEITKEATPINPRPGDEIEFRIKFTNVSDRRIFSYTVSDILPDTLTYIPNSTQRNLYTSTGQIVGGGNISDIVTAGGTYTRGCGLGTNNRITQTALCPLPADGSIGEIVIKARLR